MSIEWSATAGCEGTSMGGPPMHYHPKCPVCGGHEPEFNAKFPHCFRTEHASIRLFGNATSGVHVGHRDGCVFLRFSRLPQMAEEAAGQGWCAVCGAVLGFEEEHSDGCADQARELVGAFVEELRKS